MSNNDLHEADALPDEGEPLTIGHLEYIEGTGVVVPKDLVASPVDPVIKRIMALEQRVDELENPK